ncbi:MAG: hypothetical protein Q8R35_03130 [bacterium]|nr:hypothetical protein [bacterium]
MANETVLDTSQFPKEAVQKVRDHITLIRKRREGDMRFALRCAKHDLQADECVDCKGMTKFGLPYDAVLEIFKEEGLITVELATAKPTSKGNTVVHRRYLKTLVGIGLTCFVGFAGWRGGTLLLRLVSRGSGPSGK